MDTKKKVEILVKNDPEFRRVRGSGFWGAVTPLGELQFNIFDDAYVTPEKLEIKAPAEPGQIPQEQAINANPNIVNIIRHNHIEVTIPISALPSLIQWLQSKVAEHETNQKLLAGIPFWKEN